MALFPTIEQKTMPKNSPSSLISVDAIAAMLSPSLCAMKRATEVDGSIPIDLPSPYFDVEKVGSRALGLSLRMLPSPQLKKAAESFQEGPLLPADYAHLFLKIRQNPGEEAVLSIRVYGQSREEILGSVPDEMLASLKQGFQDEFLRVKEKDEFIPPFDRDANVSSQAHIRAILAPDMAAIRRTGENDREGSVWINMPYSVMDELRERIGVSKKDTSGDKHPSFRILPSPELEQAFGSMIYGPKSKDYHLEILDRGDDGYYLLAKYNSIIGSRKLGPVTPEVFESLKDGLGRAWAKRLNAEFKERTQPVDQVFFATPKELGLRLIERFGSLKGLRVLEPEAGQAGLADLACDAKASEVVTIENWGVNIDVLKSKGYNPIEEDFLKVKPETTGLFDAVIMNPPFSKRQDIAHVRHALSFLVEDGRLEAITSTQFQSSSIKDSKNFKELTEFVDSNVTMIEPGAFKGSGTSVATVMLSFDMKQLLDRLEEAGTDGSEFGLDLSRQWELREVAKNRFVDRQRAA